MKRVKYFGVYSGPSYGGFSDTSQLPGFPSIDDAMRYFRRMQRGSTWSDEYRFNADDEYVLWETESHQYTPATTEADSMDLYAAIKTARGTYRRADYPYARLHLGERGGVKIERH